MDTQDAWPSCCTRPASRWPSCSRGPSPRCAPPPAPPTRKWQRICRRSTRRTDMTPHTDTGVLRAPLPTRCSSAWGSPWRGSRCPAVGHGCASGEKVRGAIGGVAWRELDRRAPSPWTPAGRARSGRSRRRPAGCSQSPPESWQMAQSPGRRRRGCDSEFDEGRWSRRRS